MNEEIYRPGLEGVVAGDTSISTIVGGLEYRGYAVDELAKNASFEEVAHLLLHGELPTAAELAAFAERRSQYWTLPRPVVELLRALPAGTSMMDVMRSGASLLAHWDVDSQDNSRAAELRKAERLLAQLPIVMATRFRLARGQEPIAADPRASLAENILRMSLGGDPSPEAVRAVDVTLILYAEHEFNASTFAARTIASTLADLHSAVVGGIGALKGPLHGGANERVLDVLQQVGSVERAETWVRESLAQKVKIMGFGHRVYKDGDPRATFLKPLCQRLAAGQAEFGAMEACSQRIEEILWSEKQLAPNLDWPSARIYHYLGLPVELYTPLFVLSRVTGWSAHILEQRTANRLIRPRARYTGPTTRKFIPLNERLGGS